MSTTKGMPKKAKDLMERIDHLRVIAELAEELKMGMEYLEKKADQAEEGSEEWVWCWKNYNDKLWMYQRLEELAEEC